MEKMIENQILLPTELKNVFNLMNITITKPDRILLTDLFVLIHEIRVDLSNSFFQIPFFYLFVYLRYQALLQLT